MPHVFSPQSPPHQIHTQYQQINLLYFRNFATITQEVPHTPSPSYKCVHLSLIPLGRGEEASLLPQLSLIMAVLWMSSHRPPLEPGFTNHPASKSSTPTSSSFPALHTSGVHECSNLLREKTHKWTKTLPYVHFFLQLSFLLTAKFLKITVLTPHLQFSISLSVHYSLLKSLLEFHSGCKWLPTYQPQWVL